MPSLVRTTFWVYGAVLSVATSTLSIKKSTKATSVLSTTAVSVMVLLAVRAGLRAREIAHLSYGMVVESNGRIGSMIEVRNDIAKRGSGRRVPMHPQLYKALVDLRRRQPTSPD